MIWQALSRCTGKRSGCQLPDSGHVLYLLGTLLVQTRRYEEGAARLERALDGGRCQRRQERATTWASRCASWDGPEEAIAQYDAVLALKPDDVEALNNRGVALYDLGRADEAKACYRRVLESQPDYVQALNNLGLVLRDEKHLGRGRRVSWSGPWPSSPTTPKG